MTKETRQRLAKHYKALGKLDHPYVKEFYPEKEVVCQSEEKEISVPTDGTEEVKTTTKTKKKKMNTRD